VGLIVPVALHAPATISGSGRPIVVRLTADAELPVGLRPQHALMATSAEAVDAAEFGAVVTTQISRMVTRTVETRLVQLPDALAYLAEGDIIRIDPQHQRLDVIYRRSSHYNSLLVTERCNSKCLMCSQPPRDQDDFYIVEELLAAIPLMAKESIEIGITGGEPTLLGDDLFRLLSAARDCLPRTSVHVLSNGRRFQYLGLAAQLADVRHHDLMIGIPLYADVAETHDYVVQADGAFDETIRGLLNLARYGQRIELRVVIHKETVERLPQLATFVVRNLPFVEQVALMGLEVAGYARPNLEALWVDPADYHPELTAAVRTLDRARLRVSIYNHQLCVLPPDLWPFARSSISDWKREYYPECDGCAVRGGCGGFFTSSRLRRSAHIHAVSACQSG
jgi:His-Xaa-Ser system radical SAM maturase HxsC